jgi:hypothetical protein
MSIGTIERPRLAGDDDDGNSAEWHEWEQQLGEPTAESRAYVLRPDSVRFLGAQGMGAFTPNAAINHFRPARYRMPPVLGGLLMDRPETSS